MPFAVNEQSTFWARKRQLARLVVLVACLGIAFWFIRHSQPGPVVKGVKVSAIASHSAVLKPDGTMWVWGNGAEGLWGDTTLQVTSTPTQVGAETDWKGVAAGNDFFIGLKNDGGLWAWGGNRFGQVGDGTGGKKDHPGGEAAPASGKKEPVRIGDANDWTMIAARVFRATALKKDGSLWAWG